MHIHVLAFKVCHLHLFDLGGLQMVSPCVNLDRYRNQKKTLNAKICRPMKALHDSTSKEGSIRRAWRRHMGQGLADHDTGSDKISNT